MNQMLVKVIVDGGKQLIRKALQESPTIMTGLAVTGLVTTIGTAITGTIDAVHEVEDEELAREAECNNEVLTPVEIVKLTWRHYIPTTLLGLGTASLIIGANAVHLQRSAALTALYKLTSVTADQYRKQVQALVGERKAAKIDEAVAQGRLTDNPIEKATIIVTGKGTHLMFDGLSGRYFQSDIETVRRAVNDFNHDLLGQMYKTLNEWYDLIGLDETDMGRDVGWNVDNLLNVSFSAKMATDGAPCLVLEYKTMPVPLF